MDVSTAKRLSLAAFAVVAMVACNPPPSQDAAETTSTTASEVTTTFVPASVTTTSAEPEAPTTSVTIVTTSTTAARTTTTPPETTTTTPSGVEALKTGLFCRDLAAMGYSYVDAVTYWVREGSPGRMDTDRNGIPCETVYPADDVTGFWGDPLPTTSTTVGDVYYSIATHADSGLWPAALPGSGGWWGSGCAPGTTTLPDGIWWGHLTEFQPTSLTFDLACIQFVDDPDNDPETEDYAWLIENASERLRVVPVSPDASVACLWRNCPSRYFLYTDWIGNDSVPHGDRGRENGVWLYVNGGIVTEIADAIVAG